MAQFKIREKYIKDLKDFTWGKDWRAVRLTKEHRTSGDVYFGLIVRYYGTTDGTDDYDTGDRSKDFVWLGRHEKFVGKRVTDMNPDSATRMQRIWKKPETEKSVIVNEEGFEEEIEELVKGRVVFEYDIPDTPANVKLLKTLVGQVDMDNLTTFSFIQGNTPPISVDEESFFNTSVKNFLSAHTIEATIRTNAEKTVK